MFDFFSMVGAATKSKDDPFVKREQKRRDALALIKSNLLHEQERKTDGLSYAYSKGAMKWRWDESKLSIKGDEVEDLISFMEYLTYGEFKKLATLMKNDAEEVVRVVGLISGRVKKKKIGKLLEEIFQEANQHKPEASPVKSSTDVQDAKVAGEDYPSHVVDQDGYHLFTWAGLVYALHPSVATPEKVNEIKASSFDVFKANVLKQRELAKEVQEPEQPPVSFTEEVQSPEQQSGSLADEFSKATESLMGDEDKLFGRVPKQARHKRRR